MVDNPSFTGLWKGCPSSSQNPARSRPQKLRVQMPDFVSNHLRFGNVVYDFGMRGPLFRKDWVVYSEPPFGCPEYVLQYLGRYTHRVAISNHRLVSFTEGRVTFRWRDSAHHNEQKLLTLSLDEFLPPLPVAPALQRLRTHPPFRLPGQSATPHSPAALLSITRHSTGTAGRSRHLWL